MRFASRRRAGVSSIVGAVFFVLIMMVAIGALVTMFNSFNGYNGSVQSANGAAVRLQETSLVASNLTYGSYPPSTLSDFNVATTGCSTDSTSTSSEYKLAYGAGMWWDFFVCNSNFQYSTSFDGTTWEAAQSLTVPAGYTYSGTALTIDVVGTTVYIAIADTGTNQFAFGIGTLAAGGTVAAPAGTISFSSGNAIAAVTTPAGVSLAGPISIEVDNSGNVWVGVTSLGAAPTLTNVANPTSCASGTTCGVGFGGGSVAAGDVLAFTLGWSGVSPPTSVTDTLGNTFTSSKIASSVAIPNTPTLTNVANPTSCASGTTCGVGFGGGSVAAGDVLAFTLGWSGVSPPTSVTDTLGNSFSLGSSSSVAIPNGVPSLAHNGKEKACTATSCGQGFGPGGVGAVGDVLAFTVGWVDSAAPTISDSFGNTFALAASSSVVSGGHTYYSNVYDATSTTSGGGETITATFGTSTSAWVSAYDISGVTTASPQTSSGSSSTAVSASYVSSFTPAADSFVIGGVVTDGSTTLTGGTGYTVPGGGPGNNCGSMQGCSEYETGDGSTATTAPMSLSSNQAFAEAAIALAPLSTTYYSYIYYVTSGSSGTDTITATFASATSAMASAYDITGVTATGFSSSSDSSATAVASSDVLSFTPSSNSFVIGAVQANVNTQLVAGTGYAVPGGNGKCKNIAPYSCSEYGTATGTATTVPMGFSPNSAFAEAAIAFAATTTTYYSYIYYATSGSSGTDTITATFASSTTAMASAYDVASAVVAGFSSSTGNSSTSVASSSVTSFTPTTNAFVIGAVEANVNTAFTNGAGYAVPGGNGKCNKIVPNACSEYAVAAGTATTVPMTFAPNSGFAEAAIAFTPTFTTYYSYIYYATSGSSGTDTITATFASSTTAMASAYDITGATVVGLFSSTGNSAAGVSSAAVTSFAPTANSFVIGAVQTNTNIQISAGGGYAVPGGNGKCKNIAPYACSEYGTATGAGTAVPMTFSANSGFAEAAMAFPTSSYGPIQVFEHEAACTADQGWEPAACATGNPSNYAPAVSGSRVVLEPPPSSIASTGIIMMYETSAPGFATGTVGVVTQSALASSSWNTVTPTGLSYYALGYSSAVVIGSSLCVAGLANSASGHGTGTLNFWALPFTSISSAAASVTETQIETSAYAWQAALSSSGNTLVLFDSNGASSIQYYVSSTYGSIWSTSPVTLDSTESAVNGMSPAVNAFAVTWADASPNVRFAALTTLTVTNDSPFAVHIVDLYVADPATNGLLLHWYLNSTELLDYWVGAGSTVSIPFSFSWEASTGYAVTFGTDNGAVVAESVTSPA